MRDDQVEKVLAYPQNDVAVSFQDLTRDLDELIGGRTSGISIHNRVLGNRPMCASSDSFLTRSGAIETRIKVGEEELAICPGSVTDDLYYGGDTYFEDNVDSGLYSGSLDLLKFADRYWSFVPLPGCRLIIGLAAALSVARRTAALVFLDTLEELPFKSIDCDEMERLIREYSREAPSMPNPPT